jgi:hypothetical protein
MGIIQTDGTTDSRLYVWDAETDTIFFLNFATGLTDQQEGEAAVGGGTGSSENSMNV